MRPHQPGERHRPLRAVPDRRRRRRLARAAVRARGAALREIEDVFAQVHAAGAVPVVGGRRPLDHPADLPRESRATPAGRHGPFSTPTATPATTIWAPSSTTARRSAAPPREGLLDPKRTIQIGIRGGINDRKIWAFQPRQRHARGLHGGALRQGAEGDRRRGTARRRRRPDLCQFSTSTGSIPVYAPGTGTPEMRRHVGARGAAHGAPGCRV